MTDQYTVGVSSGMYMIASAEEKTQFMTIPRKIFRGGLEGVDFTQLDLESLTEFKEPFLKEEVERIKNLGMRFGAHGESYAMGGGEKPMGWLDSSIKTNYEHAHDRLIRHIEGLGNDKGIGAEYVNIHPSETEPFFKLPVVLQPTDLVDPWGRPFKDFFDQFPEMLNWALKKGNEFVWDFSRFYQKTTEKKQEEIYKSLQNLLRKYQEKHSGKEPVGNEYEGLMKKARKEGEKNWKRFYTDLISTSDLSYGAERTSYIIIAKWMMKNNKPLWEKIVDKKKVSSDKDLTNPDKYTVWVPAVSAQYMLGHFRPKQTDKYKDPVKLLEKNKLYFSFEAEFGKSGLEGTPRLVRPIDMIRLCEVIDSKWVSVTLDVEHVLSQDLDPMKEIKAIPNPLGKYIQIVHLGFPTPHTPAHQPIDVGSKEQKYLYDLIYELRQRGFAKGYLIYERGSSPRGTSLLAIKKIKEKLEKDVRPEDLGLDFYGMEEQDFRVKQQQVKIKEHALDPLRGLLSVPEEEHTFLAREAISKGKGEEWRKRRLR